MNAVTVAEARDQLPELLRKVAAGQSVILTDGGKPVATLGPRPTRSIRSTRRGTGPGPSRRCGS